MTGSSPLTDDAQLPSLIERYNKSVGHAHVIDKDKLRKLRNAIAHGRILAIQPGSTPQIFNFAQAGEKESTFVETAEDMSSEWLCSSLHFVKTQIDKIMEIYNPASKKSG